MRTLHATRWSGTRSGNAKSVVSKASKASKTSMARVCAVDNGAHCAPYAVCAVWHRVPDVPGESLTEHVSQSHRCKPVTWHTVRPVVVGRRGTT